MHPAYLVGKEICNDFDETFREALKSLAKSENGRRRIEKYLGKDVLGRL